jgi:hypothetical protein
LLDRAKASRRVISPRYTRSLLTGVHPPTVIGASSMMLSGVQPARSAAR